MYNTTEILINTFLKSSEIAQIIFDENAKLHIRVLFFINFTYCIHYDLRSISRCYSEIMRIIVLKFFSLFFHNYIFRHCIFPYTIFNKLKIHAITYQTSDRDTSISSWWSRYCPRRARANRGSESLRAKIHLGCGINRHWRDTRSSAWLMDPL